MIETKKDLLRWIRRLPPDWSDWPDWKKQLFEEVMKPAISAIETLPDNYQQEVSDDCRRLR
jgi:hypothetical protein